jgi:hypothetical protein
MRKLNTKVTLIVASSAITAGAIAAAIVQANTVAVQSGRMSVGQTMTTTTPPEVPPVTAASPGMKATKPKGF